MLSGLAKTILVNDEVRSLRLTSRRIDIDRERLIAHLL